MALLTAAEKAGKLPHALLFFGPSEIGKRTLAIEFVKIINCDAKEKKPCQKCRACRDIQKGEYPDLLIVEPAQKDGSFQGEIQISKIRDLIWNLSLKSYSGRLKTAIIDKAHLMNSEAQNCLLKLLEEPRGETLIILITEQPESLLPTILSRVQKIRFFCPAVKETEKLLVEQGAAGQKAKHLTAISFGKPGRAISFFSDVEKAERQDKIISDLTKIIASDLATRFQYAKDFFKDETEQRPQLKEILEVWLRYFRKIFLDNIANTAGKNSNALYLQKIKNTLNAVQTINSLVSNTNINPKIALETLLIKI